MTAHLTVTQLDNPIWHSLTTRHAQFAAGCGLARRFDREIGPLTGIREQSPEAYSALAELLGPNELAVLFLDSPPALPPGWRIHMHLAVDQMVCAEPPPAPPGSLPYFELGVPDVQEMLELTALTEPGPFRARTFELGGFLGIRDAGRLAAMAGQRLALPGFIEISAVCTHPDFRGRGYSAALVTAVARSIHERGETPILHVLPTNASAIRVYQSVGFTLRRTLHLAVILPPATEG
jgi:ribosomal protein S18 acetylase RimI-like enzyme